MDYNASPFSTTSFTPSHTTSPNHSILSDEKQQQLSFPNTDHNPVNHLHHPNASRAQAGVMVGDGAPRTHPEPLNDGWVGPNGDNHPKSQVPSSTSHTASPPGSDKLWTPVMDVHSTPSPVHEAAKTPLHGGTQHTHGPALPDNALLPTHEFGGSTPISIIPTLVPNSPSPPATTIRTTLSHRPSEQGHHHGIGLSPRIQCGPGEHARKIRDAKDKGHPHVGTPEIEFKEQSEEILIAMCPKKLLSCKLDLRVPSFPNSKNSAVSLVPLVGTMNQTPISKGKGIKKERSDQKPPLNELHNMEC
ncbi:hypothetical protein A4A49_16203 [Nicotiana attenuata]|uniref:Uncharacterized protein n=1 Tax=Nicotiana attenuata TaxID=49451 RepID=A0A314KJ00_NICAT|nr:hypothetical protein A4A49_16203 [Nicotiana attenuata]